MQDFREAGAGHGFSAVIPLDVRMPSEKANGYQTAQMAQAFLEAGCRLELVTLWRKVLKVEGLDSGTTVKEYYRLRREIPKITLPALDLVYLAQHVCKLGNFNPLTMLASLGTTFSFIPGLAFLLLRRRYDMIFLRSTHLLNGLVRVLPGRMRRKMVFEVHSLPNRPGSRRALIANLETLAGVVVINAQLKKLLVAEGVPPERICVAHDGVDLATFDIDIDRAEARRRLGISADRPIVSYVGRFHTLGQEKGIPEIIASARALLAKHPDLEFRFIGGPLDRLPVYEGMIAGEGLPRDRFVFTEKQSIDRVPLYLKASDVLLMPFPWSEHYAYNMSPLKLFEYMSSRRPIVATSLPSVCEVLEHGRNALLARPGDADSLTQCVAELLSSPSLAESLADAAYVDVKEYSWKRRAERILAFFVEASGSTARPRRTD